MRLVEQGKLDLDEDVSGHLGWTLRNPAFPDRPITLRLLLSHRSSLRDGISYALPLGTTVQQAVAAPEAWDQEHPPGSFFRYSNLGFPVVASVMEQATGERFDRLMERLVLKPLELDACFNWTTCADAAIARAVVLYAPDGTVVRDDLKGARPACPVVPAANGGCDLVRLPPRQQRRPLLAAGRASNLGPRPRQGRRAAAPQGPARRRQPLPLAKRAWPRWSGSTGASTAPMATRRGNFYCGYGLAVQILAQCAAEGRPVRRRQAPPRPCRRRLRPALGPVDRPRDAAAASPISPPAWATIRRAGARPIGRSRNGWRRRRDSCRHPELGSGSRAEPPRG